MHASRSYFMTHLRPAAVALALLLAAGCQTAPKQKLGKITNPSPEARVEPASPISRPVLCGSAEEAALVWLDVRHEGVEPEAFFIRSEDGGRTWTDERRLGRKGDPELRGHRYIRMLCRDGALHIVWRSKSRQTQEGEQVGQKFIRYRRSPDGGRTWGDLATLNDPPEAFVPDLALDSENRLVVAWNDERTGGGHRIFYNRSSDGGLTWAENAPLDFDPDTEPAVAKEGVRVALASGPEGRIHAVWEGVIEGGALPFHRLTSDGGETWSPFDAPLYDYQVMSSVLNPQIFTHPDAELLTLTWLGIPGGQSTNWGFYVATSQDGGATWSAQPQELVPPHTLNRPPHIAQDAAGTLYLTTQDLEAGPKADIFLTWSRDGGRTWSERVRMDVGTEPGTVTAENPFVAVGDEGGILVTWMDRRRQGRSSVYARFSTDAGATWSSDFYIGGGEDAGSDATWPSAVFLDAATVLIQWQEAYRGPQGLRVRRVVLP